GRSRKTEEHNSNSILGTYLGALLDGPSQLKDNELSPAITKLSDHAVRFRLKVPTPELLHVLSMAGLAIMPKGTGNFSSPDGTGPFQGTWDKERSMWRFVRSNNADKNVRANTIEIASFGGLEDGLRKLRNEEL